MTKQEKQAIAAHIEAHADEALERAGELADVPEAHAVVDSMHVALGFDPERASHRQNASVLFGLGFALGISYATKRDADAMRRIMAGAA
jgi:hypothetical protein